MKKNSDKFISNMIDYSHDLDKLDKFFKFNRRETNGVTAGNEGLIKKEYHKKYLEDCSTLIIEIEDKFLDAKRRILDADIETEADILTNIISELVNKLGSDDLLTIINNNFSYHPPMDKEKLENQLDLIKKMKNNKNSGKSKSNIK